MKLDTLSHNGMDYLESTMETLIWDLDLLEMALQQPPPNIVTLKQFSCVMLWTKY